MNTSKLMQAALELFIKSGMYEKHIAKVRKSYSYKMKKVAAIYKAMKSNYMEWFIPTIGIFIWIVNKSEIDITHVEDILAAKGKKIMHPSSFYEI